ncbi:DUF402 domain-containing protein [Actinopolymorpha alba]|uniref:DUF402 domain-containing protein n=1 Tax=Actinopolymorpha alba TaxID=533267 RepID=UPI0003A508C4|nr:DUF402 domain-containing protein [Actinopolymorpha alba]
MSCDQIVVEYQKWPGTPHYATRMVVLGEDASGIWVGTRAGAEVRRGNGKPAVVSSGDSVSLFPRGRGWTARWYARPESAGRASRYSCYVDITTPVERTECGIRVIDLDLDVVLTWAGGHAVLDEDEFGENATALRYPPSLVEHALSSCAEVRAAMASRAFPFDGAHETYAARWFGGV